jgi:hypothetical protein
MKWFEHQTSACQNKKIRKIEVFYKSRGGQAVMAAVGRFWRLHEIVGSQGLGDDNLDTYALPDDYGMEVLADDLFCSQDELVEFLELLASINSIDPDYWREKHQVYLPKLAERADTYTKRRNTIRTDNKDTSNYVRTPFKECVPPQAQAQAQAQKQAQTKSKKSLAIQPPAGGSSLPAYSCVHFAITQEHFAAILKDFPAFPEEYLLIEFLPRMRDWCADHRGDPKHKKKFDAGGRLKNPRSCFRTWLKTEDQGKADPYRRPKPAAPLPAEPPGMQSVFDPHCPACRGSGRYRDGPCTCGKLEPIVDPDTKCPKCGGRGITKDGPCECLKPRKIYETAGKAAARAAAI